MSTPNTKKYTPFGFTLVELIVVITILVILGTIAFTSLSGYSGSARDSSRISDLTNISKGLDIAYAKTSTYPMPDSYFTVTYSGGAVWYQGEIGDTVMNIMNAAGAKLSKQPPLDPLVTTAKYTYSKVAYAKDSYQLKANWEGDKIAYTSPSPSGRGLGGGLITQAQAASGNPTVAYIAGNYNGVVAKTQTGTMTYILAVPSIISNTGSIGLILAIDSAQKSLSGALLTNGGSNTTGVIYNPVVAYASGSLPSTTSEKTALATGIATAYSGTSLISSSNIKPYITAYSTNDTVALASLGGNAGSSVGGSNVVTAPVVVVVSTKFPGEDGISGNADDCDQDNITIATGTVNEQVWSSCNLGATIAFNGSNAGTYNSNASSTRGGNDNVNGKLYQWGRNKGFLSSDTSQLSTPLALNPNGSDTYNFIWSATMTGWLIPSIPTIWGGSGSDTSYLDAQTDKALRQGPCPLGWHVPSPKDWKITCDTIHGTVCNNGSNTSDTAVQSTLRLPYAGFRSGIAGSYYSHGTTGYYWASSPYSTTGIFGTNVDSSAINPTNNTFGSMHAFSVRCIHN